MLKDFKPILKNSKFVYLWNSQIFSQLTINIMNFLFLTRIFQNTGSAIATSLLWVAYALPAIFIGPFAAATVDLLNKRKLLMISNLLQAVTIFIYSFSHNLSLFLLYGVALIYSLLNQFYVPSELATLPYVVKEKNYPTANSLFFVTQQAAIIVGFGVAGILTQVMGFTNSLYLGSFMLFLAFISVSFLPDIESENKVPESIEKAVVGFFKRIIEGYEFLKSKREVLIPFGFMIGLQVLLTVIVVNIPLIAEGIFDISVDLAGLVLVAPTGVGAAIGAIHVPKKLKSGLRKYKVVKDHLAYMAASALAVAIVVPLLSGIYKPIIGALSLVMMGYSFVGVLVPAQTFLQEKTPGGYRGRVFGNYWFIVTIATIFPVVFSGTFVEIFGIRSLIIILSALIIASFVLVNNLADKVIGNSFYIRKR